LEKSVLEILENILNLFLETSAVIAQKRPAENSFYFAHIQAGKRFDRCSGFFYGFDWHFMSGWVKRFFPHKTLRSSDGSPWI